MKKIFTTIKKVNFYDWFLWLCVVVAGAAAIVGLVKGNSGLVEYGILFSLISLLQMEVNDIKKVIKKYIYKAFLSTFM